MKTISYYHVDVFSNKPLSGNGLTVFTESENFSKSVMQRLTQEMKQFESIFISKIEGNKVRAFVFTCEEELDFAGHPVLGAAATLHDLFQNDKQKTEWVFILNNKEVTVTVKQNSDHYEAVMNQGNAEFGKLLNEAETKTILDCMNLKKDDLYPDCKPIVVSTGLPYLLIPLQKNAFNSKILVPDLEERIKRFGAKFIGTIEIPSLNIRTWDNAGTVEDIATGSLAGPSGAYLVKQGFQKANCIIQLNQGENLGRPSQLFVEVKMQSGKLTDVIVGGGVWKISQSNLEKDLFKNL